MEKWEAVNPGHNAQWKIINSDGLVVAYAESFGGVIPEQVEETARLIAAAPELLQCLIDVLPHLESIGPLAEFERARSVIEKATGHDG